MTTPNLPPLPELLKRTYIGQTQEERVSAYALAAYQAGRDAGWAQIAHKPAETRMDVASRGGLVPTEEQIRLIAINMPNDELDAVIPFARAIESAVLAKLKERSCKQ